MVYWWVGNLAKNWYRDSQIFEVRQTHPRTILVKEPPPPGTYLWKVSSLGQGQAPVAKLLLLDDAILDSKIWCKSTSIIMQSLILIDMIEGRHTPWVACWANHWRTCTEPTPQLIHEHRLFPNTVHGLPGSFTSDQYCANFVIQTSWLSMHVWYTVLSSYYEVIIALLLLISCCAMSLTMHVLCAVNCLLFWDCFNQWVDHEWIASPTQCCCGGLTILGVDWLGLGSVNTLYPVLDRKLCTVISSKFVIQRSALLCFTCCVPDFIICLNLHNGLQ